MGSAIVTGKSEISDLEGDEDLDLSCTCYEFCHSDQCDPVQDSFSDLDNKMRIFPLTHRLAQQSDDNNYASQWFSFLILSVHGDNVHMSQIFRR